MTQVVSDKKYYIELFRKNGFNCFPISNGTKIADYRYKGSKTQFNQAIKDDENYGYIPIQGFGTAIIDFDDKEKYRPFVEHMVSKGCMVVETPHGWHIPVKGLAGNITKIELFDYAVQDKKIIEIQGINHYCVGVGSQIFDDEIQQMATYVNRGTQEIWDGNNIDFHQFVDEICEQCKVSAHKRNNRSSYENMRKRFIDGKPPTKGTSNDYFFQAGMQCNTDGLTRHEALEKIRIVYDKWSLTDDFSQRSWSNIETKVNEVYDKDLKIRNGRPNGTNSKIDTTKIVDEFLQGRKIYSDRDTHEIFENNNGFLEKINNSLHKYLQKMYRNMEKSDYNSILFKLEGQTPDMPTTNKDLVSFKNGKFSHTAHGLVQSDDIADMGFRNYNYLPPTTENHPKKFLSIMFDNVRKEEHPRIKAGLRSILRNYLDPKISITHGLSGVGKSTGPEILVIVLGVYALSVSLDDFLNDRFIRAKIKGIRLLVFQDLPKVWSDFSQIKTLTGEQLRTERGFMQDAISFESKLKVWASCNYLPRIPEDEQNAMYSRRLSLIHNVRQEQYPEDSALIGRVAMEEGEKIISWILNLTDEECKYEDGKTVKAEWEVLASPEIGYLTTNWEFSDTDSKIPVIALVDDLKEKTGEEINIKQMSDALKNRGYVIEKNMIKNIKVRTRPSGQERIDTSI